MTIAQYLPQWLRNRFTKPAPPKPTTATKKDRQVLPTLPEQSRSVIFSQDDGPAGYRPVIPNGGWRKKGAANETGHPISKPVALP